jgi:hydrogenase small subunit
MKTTRRDFIRYCGVSAAALGLTATDLFKLETLLANPNGPTVLWLQGAGCTGCSVSLLNRVSTQAPVDAADLLINSINLVAHTTMMAAAGDGAVQAIADAHTRAGFILAVEGGIPQAFGGAAGWAWSIEGQDVTIAQAVKSLAMRASHIVSIGTCAAWGGIPAAPPNLTGVTGVGAFLGRRTINIAGCPPHPDWIVWAIVQVVLGRSIELDSYGRPRTLFRTKVHDRCPLKETEETKQLGQPNRCLKELGCRGPETEANCPSLRWNNGANWCVGAGAICAGCTRPSFPGRTPFYRFSD